MFKHNTSRSIVGNVIVAILLSTFNSAILCAQHQPDTLKASQYFSLGDSLLKTNNFDQAIVNFEKALLIYKQSQDWEKYVGCHNKLANNYWRISDYSQALKMAKKALEISDRKLDKTHIERANALHYIGEVNTDLGNYDVSLQALNKSLTIKKDLFGQVDLSVANTYNSIGSTYCMQGNNNKCLEYLNKALDLRRKILGDKSNTVAASYSNIGLVHLDRGDINQAIEFQEKALKIDILENNKIDLAISYANLAASHSQNGAHEIALEYEQKALALFKKVLGENHFYVAGMYQNIGASYADRLQHDKAIELYKKAIEILKELGLNGGNEIAIIYHNIGKIYSKQHAYSLALKNYEKALKIYYRQEIQPPKTSVAHLNLGILHRNMNEYELALEQFKKGLAVNMERLPKSTYMADLYNEIGSTLNMQKKNIEAIESFQQAIVSNSLSFEEFNIYRNPKLSETLNPIVLLTSLKGKAKNFTDLFKRTGSSEDLEKAYQTHLLCDSLIDQIRQSYQRHDDKVKSAQEAHEVYTNAVESSLLFFNETNDLKYKQLAFYFSQKSKSGVLKEAIADLSAKSITGLPDHLLSLERNLKVDMSYYRSSIQEKKNQNSYDTAEVLNYERELFTLSRTFDSLQVTLEQQYPEYYKLKYKNDVISIAELQQRLPNGTVLLEYFQGTQTLSLFSITKNRFDIIEIPIDSSILNQINSLGGLLQNNSFKSNEDEAYDQFSDYSSGIYNAILADALTAISNFKEIHQLVIIPDGYLGYVPFEILLTDIPLTSKRNYANLPYLFKEYDISYGYSAALMYDNHLKASNSQGSPSYVAFAPEYINYAQDSSEQLILGRFRNEVRPLKWNAHEVNNIANYLQGQQYIGKLALESQFKSEVDRYSIIHLAMHALIDDEKPMNSKLIFTQNQDSTEDGYLYAHELYNMELNADLTVLSACNTGFGKLARGEGIMSLARAFSYAGCPSIVMSHWSVDDESTAQLMELFYKKLSDGLSKDEALRQAKLDYLETANPDKMHPRYWASFVVLGDTSPITSSTRFSWLWPFIASALFLIGIIGYFRSRN